MIGLTHVTVVVFCDHARVDNGEGGEASHRPCSNQVTLSITSQDGRHSFEQATEVELLDILLESEAAEHQWNTFTLSTLSGVEAHICPEHANCSIVANPAALDEALTDEDTEPWRCGCPQPTITGQEELALEVVDAELRCACWPIDPAGKHGHACDLHYQQVQ